jgi:hypothetical protein
MSYCHKCGAKLDKDARFCRACGTPVEIATIIERVPQRRRTGSWQTTTAIILIAILLVAFFVAIAAFFPVKSVNFNQTYEVAKIPNVDAVSLNFDADVADVNLIPADLPNQLVKMEVLANGSTALFGSDTEPVKIIFTNETFGRDITVTSDVSRSVAWPFSFNLKVTCNIYVDISAPLNINVQTSVGKIHMNTSVPVVFQNLALRTTTGNVEAYLTGGTILTANSSFSTTTGSIKFIWDNIQVTGNTDLQFASTTGSINADFTQNQVLSGNVSVEVTTTTGSLNVGMNVSDNVGAQLTSHTTTGSISVDAQSFNGNKSPIYSSNYPATSNFLVNSQTTTGSIHLTVAYQPPEAPIQEQVRDAVMNFIKTNHGETAQFMQNLNWAGGRVNRGLIVGAELYTYISDGWNVTMTYPVVPNTIYTVTSDYKAQDTGIPYRVIWGGTWQNNTITETDYTFAQ